MVEFSSVAIGVLVTFEFGYFVKAFLHSLAAKYFRRKIGPLEASRVFGICTFRDVDILLNHINNARYVRAMDFGRLDFITRTCIFSNVKKSSGSLLIAASTIRYRKPIYLFMPYYLETKIVFWDEKNLYFRQDFRTPHDNFLRATSYTKLAVLGMCPEKLLLGLAQQPLRKPSLSDDLLAWINYNNHNSELLKAENS